MGLYLARQSLLVTWSLEDFSRMLAGDGPQVGRGRRSPGATELAGGLSTFPSQDIGTILAVQDYAGAWTADRGRCHRFVYTEDDGRPINCPGPPVRSGWRQDGQRRWYVVDACVWHSAELLAHPRPNTATRSREI